MDLRDLIFGIEVEESPAVSGLVRTRDSPHCYESDELEDDDEDYMEECCAAQILEYSDSQQPVERLKLACIVRDIPPSVPSKGGKQNQAGGSLPGNLFYYLFS